MQYNNRTRLVRLTKTERKCLDTARSLALDIGRIGEMTAGTDCAEAVKKLIAALDSQDAPLLDNSNDSPK